VGFLERVAPPGLILLTAVMGWLYIGSVVPGRECTPAQYPLLAAAFLGAVGFTARTRVGRQRVREAIRFLAADSYSLDLVHCTVVYAFRRLGPGDPRAGAVMAVLVGNGVVLAVAVASERRHQALARWLKRHVGAAGA
jgi:peptidoglycan/LPS O-acetylase OafA/YrhL